MGLLLKKSAYPEAWYPIPVKAAEPRDNGITPDMAAEQYGNDFLK
tara:strand:+ start:164 stop:298 length:135 start_codon:yes stop_codon:yes gene_type:complete